MAACLQCGQGLTTKNIGAWFPGKGLLCSKCATQGPGKATISLLFQDGDYKESGDIILSCDRAGFKGLLECMVAEGQQHVAKDAELEKQPEFMCLECGHKFYSMHAAEEAAFGDGCPECSGSDIEVA